MSLLVQGLFTQKCTYRQPLGCDYQLRSDSQHFFRKPCCRGEMRLSARPCCVNGAATANRRLRFLGFARNDTKTHGMTMMALGMTLGR